MNKYLPIFLFLILITIVLVPKDVNAYDIKKWQKNLKDVAEMLEKKNYVYDENNLAGRSYDNLKKSSSLVKIKSYAAWSKTASGEKVLKKYTVNNFNAKGLCAISGNTCANKYYKNRYINYTSCNKCHVANCTAYCYAKSKLGSKKCLQKKSFNKKNKYFRDKWCKDVVNTNKRTDAYWNYRDNTANKNVKKLNAGKGIICHWYIKYALEKSGLYKASDFDAKRQQLSKETCDALPKSRFTIIVPSDSLKYTEKNRPRCYHQAVDWLNVYRGKNNARHRPKLLDLAKAGKVKKGDIISQFDGSGHHTEVFMGYNKKTGNITIYGVGSVYQVNKRLAGKYGLEKGPKFLVKSKILSTQKDKRNQHNNPEVAAIIRIK